MECLAARIWLGRPGRRQQGAGERIRLHARREVILCAGAFNTPQLLGSLRHRPARWMEKHGIAVRVDLPGVGENLRQDRYEVTVVKIACAATSPSMEGHEVPSAQSRRDAIRPSASGWTARVHTPPMARVVALLKPLDAGPPAPDLFLFGLLGNFRGYYPGYRKDIAQDRDHFTWAVLRPTLTTAPAASRCAPPTRAIRPTSTSIALTRHAGRRRTWPRWSGRRDGAPMPTVPAR